MRKNTTRSAGKRTAYGERRTEAYPVTKWRLRGRKQKLTLDASKAEGLEPPFIILCNHESFYDFYYMNELMKNYKPALKEKLEKVAPEMVEILFKVKELVKNNAGTIMQHLPAPAGN